jgi:hypothetical protein
MASIYCVTIDKTRRNISAKSPADALRKSYQEHSMWDFTYALEEWFLIDTDTSVETWDVIDKIRKCQLEDVQTGWELVYKELMAQPLQQGRPIVTLLEKNPVSP